MKPVRIREDVDPTSAAYRRQLIIVTGIVVFLTLTGGSCLGYRIRNMEAMNAERMAKEAQENSAVETSHETKDSPDKAHSRDR